MSSGFISEAEISEQRKLRQEEWNRVRTADQPLDPPEQQFDPRSLYERLQEQKNKRDTEYEEAHKLKNMIKGLDDDEVEFLDLVDRTKLEEERKKNLEEEKEMRDFKAAVASLQEKSLDERLKQELKNPQSAHKNSSGGSGRSSQLRLLAGAVVKKSGKSFTGNDTRGTKRKLAESDNNCRDEVKNLEKNCVVSEKTPEHREDLATETDDKNFATDEESNTVRRLSTGGMKCIGILPGLGSYQDSSDSDCSSDTDQESDSVRSKYDLLGREIKCIIDKGKS